MKRVNVTITGRVQGVYYRESTRAEAARLGVTGWIANHADGSVRGAFEGNPGAVDMLLRWCRTGPSEANVLDVREDDDEPVGSRDFEVRPTIGATQR